MSLFDFSYPFPSTIEELDRFTGKEFEVFLFEFFRVLGYNPRLTDDSNDKGIDLFIKIPEGDSIKNVGIQAKRWKSKVGALEIRNMLDGKAHYNLDEVWIVTTSDLTAAAITTAMNNRIEIINRDRVELFLEELKKYDVKFREKREIKTKKDNKHKTSTTNLDEGLRQLRIKIAKKYKISPLYNVFNNASLLELEKNQPKTLDALKKIRGFGEKKIALFGKDIIAYFKNSDHKDFKASFEKFLKAERTKIAKYNNLKPEAVFSDEVIVNMIENPPQKVADLENIASFDEENIKIFGEYLVRKIAVFLK